MFTSSMSILVNGSAKKEFIMKKRLCQGNLLSPFLFALAMKGLTSLMKKAVVLNEFAGFWVNDEVFFDILQFADDTIIFGE